VRSADTRGWDRPNPGERTFFSKPVERSRSPLHISDVTYHEYEGGHDWICWQQYLPEALTVLLGR
jgi:enterochelin esterase-like enzyme